MAKIYRKVTVCGDDFVDLYLQLQADAEFIHTKDDEDTLPYLIEVGVGKSQVFMEMNQTNYNPVANSINGLLYWMTLRVFESEIDKLVYIGAEVEQDYIRRGKISVSFNPLVREKKK